MHHKSSQSSVVLRVFALILACFFSAVAAVAQEKATNIASAAQSQTPATQSQTIGTVVASTAGKTDVPAAVSESPKTVAATSTITSTPATPSNDSTATTSTPSAKSKDNTAPSTSANTSPGTSPNTSNASNDYKKTLGDLEALYEREVQNLEQRNTQVKGLYRDGLVARVEMEKSDKELADARAKVEETRNQIALANQPAPIVPAASVNLNPANAAWSTGNSQVDSLVRFYGAKYGVDPYLIYCLMHQESRFASNVTSPKGARGLMQLMPGTAARYGVTNPYDVAQSIMGGTRYLKDLLLMFNGRIDLALAGYNAGENAVIKHGYTIPPYQETRNYVRLITARYAMKPAG